MTPFENIGSFVIPMVFKYNFVQFLDYRDGMLINPMAWCMNNFSCLYQFFILLYI